MAKLFSYLLKEANNDNVISIMILQRVSLMAYSSETTFVFLSVIFKFIRFGLSWKLTRGVEI